MNDELHVDPVVTRLARVFSSLPVPARRALAEVADREDLPLAAGAWEDDGAGCLVANVVASCAEDLDDQPATLDLRILALIPELSSRDLNRMIVAWDEAAAATGRDDDPVLRALLRQALQLADLRTEFAAGRARLPG